MADYPKHDNSEATYVFSDGYTSRRDFLGAIIERGPLLSFVTTMALIIGAFGLYMWTQQDAGWDGTLVLGLTILFLPALNYLWFVMEIRLRPEHFCFRRFKGYRSLPWEKISRIRVYSLKTTGITYVLIKGHPRRYLAFFTLWLPSHRPEKWEELIRLLEHLKRHVPVKHTA